jgi:hypothetical protein
VREEGVRPRRHRQGRIRAHHVQVTEATVCHSKLTCMYFLHFGRNVMKSIEIIIFLYIGTRYLYFE